MIGGGIRQVAIVTRDADAVMRHWAEVLRVGPFFMIPEVRLEDFTYMGQASEAPLIKVGLAQSRDLQIEVIQPLDDLPSIYRDFLADGRDGGLQHLSYWVSEAADFDRAIAHVEGLGMRCVQSSRMSAFDLRTAYYQSKQADAFAPQFEVSELLKVPEMAGLVAQMDQLNRSWDGSDPIRELGF